MIPFANETVTLYHRLRAVVDGRSRDAWERRTLSGCSIVRRAKSAVRENHVAHSEEVICRIPASYQAPSIGDIIIPGVVSVEVTGARDVNALVKEYEGAFHVNSVKHNNRPGTPLPHYAVKGE